MLLRDWQRRHDEAFRRFKAEHGIDEPSAEESHGMDAAVPGAERTVYAHVKDGRVERAPSAEPSADEGGGMKYYARIMVASLGLTMLVIILMSHIKREKIADGEIVLLGLSVYAAVAALAPRRADEGGEVGRG